MNSLIAQQLLMKAAYYTLQEKEALSKEKILKVMNEVKYLSSLRKIPKMTLRKEVIHLEEHLKGVFDLEEMLLKKKRQESTRLLSLKREMNKLKQQLVLAKDKELHRKLEKMSHLIGESLAKKEVHKEVARAAAFLEQQKGGLSPQEAFTPKETLNSESISRFHLLQERILALKQELEITGQLNEEMPKEKVQVIESQILMLEQRLKHFHEKYPEVMVNRIIPTAVGYSTPVIKEEVKHVMLFGPDDKTSGKDEKDKKEGKVGEVKNDKSEQKPWEERELIVVEPNKKGPEFIDKPQVAQPQNSFPPPLTKLDKDPSLVEKPGTLPSLKSEMDKTGIPVVREEEKKLTLLGQGETPQRELPLPPPPKMAKAA